MFHSINNTLKNYVGWRFLAPFVGTTYGVYHCCAYNFKKEELLEYTKSIADAPKIEERLQILEKLGESRSWSDFDELVKLSSEKNSAKNIDPKDIERYRKM